MSSRRYYAIRISERDATAHSLEAEIIYYLNYTRAHLVLVYCALRRSDVILVRSDINIWIMKKFERSLNLI